MRNTTDRFSALMAGHHHLLTLKTIFFAFTFTILLIAIVLLSCISFRYAERLIKNDAVAYFKNSTSHQLKELTIRIEYIEGLALTISDDEEVISDILDFAGSTSVEERYYIQQNLSTGLAKKYSYIEDIFNVNILTHETGDMGYQFDNSFFDMVNMEAEAVSRINESMYGWMKTPAAIRHSYSLIDDTSISYHKKVYQSRYDGRGIGHVLINIDEDYFLEVLNTGYDKYATRQFIVDSEGIIMADTEGELFGRDIASTGFFDSQSTASAGERFYLSQGRVLYADSIDRLRWSIWSVTSHDVLFGSLRGLRIQTALAGVSILLIVSLVLFELTRIITRPIREIADIMVNFEGPQQITRSNLLISETKSLYSSYNAMTLRIRNLFDRLTREEEKKAKAELRALQAQINPHFLYNTLDSIHWLALQAKQPVIGTLIYKLGRIMRLSLNEGEAYYRLEDELEHINCYLDIQQIRFKNAFQVIRHIDKSLNGSMVLKLLIQPMVENAINHGFRNRRSGNILKIGVRQRGDNLAIEIEDNGHGMSPRQLEEILKQDHPSRGCGVKNVQERIKLFYGEDFGVQFHSREGRGTTVSIRIPKIDRKKRAVADEKSTLSGHHRG